MRVATRWAGIVGVGIVVISAGVVTATADARTSNAVADIGASVVIGEIANGARSFVELRNDGDVAADLTGYALYRCDAEGLRAKATQAEADLSGVVIAPGGVYTVGTPVAGVAMDAPLRAPFSTRGFGAVLLGTDDTIIDSIAVYPNEPSPTESECAPLPNLPVTLAEVLDESWQRADDGRWLRAAATPGDPVRGESTDVAGATVRIDEIAPAGPAGRGDDFIEIVNASATAVDLAGWRIYRCTRAGAATPDTLRHVFGPGDALDGGERLVIGGPAFSGHTSVRASTSLADAASGALVVDASGRRVDGVTISSHTDSACQTGDDKLSAVLDHRTGESWQRQDAGAWAIGARTPGLVNRSREAGAARTVFSYTDEVAVAISEVANDPSIPGREQRNHVELGNFGARTVDMSGWRIVACDADGFRRFDDLAVVANGTILGPGETWLTALEGSAAASLADAVYAHALPLEGAGVWVEDGTGRRVDSVGIYHRNEMDQSIEPHSPCTKGLSLSTFGVDRLRDETYQRAAFTGDDMTDFAPANATPGVLAPLPGHGLDGLDGLVKAAAQRAADHPGVPVAREPLAAEATQRAAPPEHVDRARAEVTATWAGVSAEPLSALVHDGEVALEPGVVPSARDDGFGWPFLRFDVEVNDGRTVQWRGWAEPRTQVRLSVWREHGWRTLDEITAGEGTTPPGAELSPVTLQGVLAAGEAPEGTARLLVQVVPRTGSPIDDRSGLASPEAYDLAISHMTDTQYYSEAYPEVYAAQVGWIAAEAAARKVAFSVHTGDLIQNWVDPDQREPRARREFEIASRMQAVLDEAGIANSVLPGNHDNKRGITADLFNEYFPPARYDDEPWYGGSIAPGDNSANWARFTAAGADFLVVSLPYAYGEREIAWAEGVLAAHPDANVIVATHEHLTPKEQANDAERSTTSRWVSHADVLWERVIAPHRNVFLVLSGHFHGLGRIVTEDAGGIPGHSVVEVLADYQEFRTHTGERATGFQRLLQIDLAGGVMAVDTVSAPLGATSSFLFDYGQFLPDDGRATTPSNERPWNIVASGRQHRYTAADDEFSAQVLLQHRKAIETDAVTIASATTSASPAHEPAR